MSAASTRAIASLLRLAAAARRDAELLAGHGRYFPASGLAADAAGWVVQAVAVSEAGWPSAVGLDAIPDENPLRDVLADLMRACPPRPAPVRPNGLQAAEPDERRVGRSLDQLASVLALAAERFVVNLDGEGPAGRDTPLRREPVPVPDPEPPVARRIAVLPALVPPVPRPVPPGVPITRPALVNSLSSTGFWALMDGWRVDDMTALALLRHGGGLTKQGTRPRFKLAGAEAERFVFLRDLDTSLRSLGVDPCAWLGKPVAAAPFVGETPLAFLAAGGAAREVTKFVLQQGLRLSMR